MKALIRFISMVLMTFSSANALAQAYPTRPITIVVPNVPGSAYEAALRYVSNELTKRLGQPIIIEYKPGAGQTIGINHVRGAKPDGYTLLYGSVLGVHPLVTKNNFVDATKDLSPISAYAFTPYIILTSTRFKSLQELVAYSTANPGKLKMATTTPLTTLAYSLLMQKTGFTADLIPYKGSGQVIVAVLSGDVDVGSATTPGIAQQVEAGKLNAVLVTSTKRLPILPNVPSAGELGLSDLTSLGFSQGLWGPPGLPKEIAQKLSTEITRILKTPEADKALINTVGGDLLGTTPEEQLRQFEGEINSYKDAAKLINFKPE